MKKAVLIILLIPFFGKAQETKPFFPDVVRTFFKSYTYENQFDPIEGIQFAKKKEGWTVMVIDRITDSIKAEYLFWSAKDKQFLPLKFGEGTKDYNEKSEAYISEHSFDLYSYNRNVYYGYSGWQDDVIAGFGNKDLKYCSDTLIESLGRAYASTADMFLSYYFGNAYRKIGNSEVRPGKLDHPSLQRIDSVNYYIRKAIASFQFLFERNPGYQTLVGNSGGKWFNEQMHGYQQMMMAGYPDLAKEFITMIQPEEVIRKQAKNYLSSCAPNSILFTYGDNDTYPLWWIQQAENYRTDVTVINNNLLSLPIYIQGLKQVEYSSKPTFYGDSSFLYWQYAEEGRKSMRLPELLYYIQTKKKIYSSDSRLGNTYSFPATTITLPVDTARFRKIGSYGYLGTEFRIKLHENYLVNNELMILDIVNSNIYKRPIYFTSPERLFENYLSNEGFVYRLLPLDQKKKTLNDKISMTKMVSFSKEKLSLLPTNDVFNKITFTGFEDHLYTLYALLASWYIQNNKTNQANLLIKDLVNSYNNQLPFSFNEKDIWLELLKTGDTAAIRRLETYAEKIESLYRNPDPILGYLPLQYAIYYLDDILNRLKMLNISNEKIINIKSRL
jgi:hypothetical protein